MPKPQLKPIEERDPYAAKVMEAFDKQSTACRLCEFEEGWGKPFCGACGNIFDEVPILQRIREYVAGVNDDYKEDEERDQTLAMIDALIRHNVKELAPPLMGNAETGVKS
jgi:hypothetical protein